MSSVRIFPPEGWLEATVTLPLSKSMSARALIIAAMTHGAPLPGDVAVCDDTEVLRRALSAPAQGRIDIGAAGTAMRFLTAYYAVTPGAEVTLDGSDRMRQRPIGPLVDALRELGASISYLGEEGYPPLLISGRRIAGGEVTVDATVSSQYISALLMAAPAMDNGLTLKLKGEPASMPYIRMTMAMMERAGVDPVLTEGSIKVPAGPYAATGCAPEIEGDWSAAAPWYEIVALSAGQVTIPNLPVGASVQGDSRLARIYAKLCVDTCPEGEEGLPELTANPDPDARASVDFADCPDLAQCVVVTCVMLRIPFRFTGLANLVHKETDRLAALRTEMARVGASLEILPGGVLEWDGSLRPVTELPVFDTHDDHRMAMCLAPVSLYIPGIVINDPEVVSKSYPEFWEQLQSAGFMLSDGSAPLAD